MNETQLTVQEPSMAHMLQSFIERGITAENVSAFEQLCALRERVEAKQHEKEFFTAFVALQRKCSRIQATKQVPDKQGNIKFTFAPFEDIMKEVQPLLNEFGFGLTFDMRFSEGRNTAICTLIHESGHARSNEFAVRIGNGPPGASESQADGSANSYAKRFALCNALNIVIEKAVTDADARIVGENVDADTARDLRRRAEACGADISAFLQYAGANTFEAIPKSSVPKLEKQLAKKEAEAAKKAPQDGTDAKDYTKGENLF